MLPTPDGALPAAGRLPWGGLAWEAPLSEGIGRGKGGTLGILPTGSSGVGGTVDGGYRRRMGCYRWWGGNGRLLAARQRQAGALSVTEGATDVASAVVAVGGGSPAQCADSPAVDFGRWLSGSGPRAEGSKRRLGSGGERLWWVRRLWWLLRLRS
jgi:hypothetical protein